MIVTRQLYWTCPGSCPGVDGSRPAEFFDEETFQVNAESVTLAWRQNYGEDYPAESDPSPPVQIAPGTVVRPRQADDPQGVVIDGLVGVTL